MFMPSHGRARHCVRSYAQATCVRAHTAPQARPQTPTRGATFAPSAGLATAGDRRTHRPREQLCPKRGGWP
ncbi:hypothetical protein EI94DRAFT_1731869, partial [Lactarius quietus]